MASWVAIAYRDFHDVPRLVVFQHGGVVYLLDASFDDSRDEYPDVYQVVELSVASPDAMPASWEDLSPLVARRLGTVAVASVRFDPTRREQLDVSSIDALITPV